MIADTLNKYLLLKVGIQSRKQIGLGSATAEVHLYQKYARDWYSTRYGPEVRECLD